MKDPEAGATLLLIIAFALFSTFCFGYWEGVELMQNEAVKHSGAKWINDEHGRPIFQWNQ